MTTDVGVALSGSGFLFPAHVGALAGIQDLGFNIAEIVGTSGGGLVAILVATGMSLPDLKNLVMTEDWSQFLQPNYFSWWDGVYNATPLQNWVQTNTNNKTFGQTNIPLTVACSNISDDDVFYFSTANTPDVPLYTGGRATSSLPFLYPYVTYNNMILMDGGMVDNIPLDQLNTTIKIGVDLVDGGKATPLTNPSIVQIIEQVISIMIASNESYRLLVGQQNGDTIISVNTGGYSFLDDTMTVEQRTWLYDQGYNAAQETMMAAYPQYVVKPTANT